MVIERLIVILNEDDEYERDAAWDDVRMTFPDADYIEAF